MRSYNPRRASPRGGFGLLPGRSPLLGESFLFSFPPGTKMFQFPGLALPKKAGEWPSFRRPGCPIRISADQRSSAPTRGLSQLVTSFIASVSLGIRHPPSTTFYAEHTFGCRMQPPPSGGGLEVIDFVLSTVLPVSTCQRSLEGRKADGWRVKLWNPPPAFFLSSWRISDSNRWPLACHASALAG